jgi:mannose-6-phosphate isomerase class I
MPSTNIIFLKPHFEQKIWGGNHLKKYHYDLPSTKTGEA